MAKKTKTVESGEQADLEKRLQVMQLALNDSEKRNKEVNASLSRSEEKYRNLFESMEDAFCIIEMIFDEKNNPVDFRYLETNHAFLRHTGKPMLGKTIREMVPDFEQFWMDAYGKVALTGQPVKLEHIVKGLGDQWFQTSAVRVGGADSRQVAVVFSNITERKHTEERLHARELRQDFLVKLGDLLRPLNNPIAVQKAAARSLAKHLSASRVFYAELISKKGVPHFLVETGYNDSDAPLPKGPFSIEKLENLVEQLREGDIVVINDVNEVKAVSREKARLRSIKVEAFVLVPIIKENQLAGVFFADQVHPRQWKPEEVLLIQETAERTWEAIHRTRAEAAVRESETRLQLALNTGGFGTFMWYPLEDRGEPDKQMLALFGLPEDGTLTLKEALSSLIYEPDRMAYNGAVIRAMDPRGDGKLQIDIRVIQPDGSLRWVTIHAQVFFAGKPRQPEKMVGMAIDITKRKQIEESLHRLKVRKDYLLQLTDIMNPLFIPADIQYSASRLLCEHLAMDRAYYCEIDDSANNILVPNNFTCHGVPSLAGKYPLEDLEWMIPAFRKTRVITVTDTRTSSLIPMTRHAALDAVQIRAFVAVALIKNDRFVAALFVTTSSAHSWRPEEIELIHETAERTWAAVERAHTEQALQRSEQNYRAIVNQSLAGIVKLDLSGNITFANTQFSHMLGYSIKELQKHTLASITHESERARQAALFAALAHKGKSYGAERRFIKKDGSVLWVNNQVAPIFDSVGQPESAVIISVDISKHKAIEYQKDEFISIASHELKTPLTSIKAYGELLGEMLAAISDTPLKEYIRRLNIQIDRMAGLVHSLLDTSRMSGGQLKIQPEETDLNLLIADRIKEAQVISSKHGLIFQAGTLPIILVDKERIGQVVTNFITNAVKYSPEGKEVVITTLDTGKGLKVSVQDFGIGISKDMHQKIFQRFYRVSGEDSGYVSGIGLGLYIAIEIIKKHGGTIGVESELGKGAVFYFELPYETP